MPDAPATFRRRLPLLTLMLLTGCATHARPEDIPRPAVNPPAMPPPSLSAALPLSKSKRVRIMPLGDSITRGSGSGYGNYRRPLQALLSRGGYAFQFVGTNTEQSQNYHGADPEQTFHPYQPEHEGYGGFRIEQISADTPAKDDGGVPYPGLAHVLTSDKPDVVLLMLGTNDVNQAFDTGGPGYAGGTGFAADAAARLDTLLNRLTQDSPQAALIVAAITPLGDPAKDAQARAYNALIPQIVATHKKQGQTILFVDMRSSLTPGDLSPDGVHPGTPGYDKMARVWYQALTGQTPLPLPSAGPTTYGLGRLDAKNVFTPATKVAVSSTFAGAELSGARLVDGTPKAFIFGDVKSERVSLSGWMGTIGRLRFFDAPSYTVRTPATVTIYSSPAAQASLSPADYVKLGTFPLPVVGDAYEGRTSPAAHPDAGDPVAHPAATIGFCDLAGLKVPTGTRSLLLDFSKSDGYGDALSEIQAFTPGPAK